MLGLDPRAENKFVQRVEQAAVRDEQERAFRVPLQPFAYDTHRSLARLMPLLGIGRQVFDQTLMRLKSELPLDVVDHQAFEASEMTLLQLAVYEQGLVEALGHDRGRLERARQGTGDDQIDRTVRKRSRGEMRLRNTKLVERQIGVPLKASLDVPVRLAVAEKIESSLWDRQGGALLSGGAARTGTLPAPGSRCTAFRVRPS